MSVLNQDVEIVNRLGLHAQAAAALVRVTNQFESDITLAKGGIAVNAKSILGMMTSRPVQDRLFAFNVPG